MDFQREYSTAVQLYSKLGGQIQELCSLNISGQLTAYINIYSALKNCDPAIVRKIVNSVKLYQGVENEAQRYVMRARNFAKENHGVAENVKNGKKYHERPEVMLKNFAKTAKRLGEAFEAVVNKHSQVERDIAVISGDVSKARQQAGTFSDEATADVMCTMPVVSLVTAPMIRASQYADEVSNPVGKVLAGCAGFVTGIIGAALSTALVGIPTAAVVSAENERIQKLKNEYHRISSFLDKFDMLVKDHRKMLNDIYTHVQDLASRYEEFKDDLRSSGMQLEDYEIDLFQDVCNNITYACNVYLANI